jgi:methyl-accepting chemotaxis protein
MDEISMGVNEINNAMTNVSEIGVSLNENAEQLNVEVSKFKI